MPVAVYGTSSMRERRLRFPKSVAIRGATSRPTKLNAAPSHGRTPPLGCGAGATGRTGTGAGAGTRTGAGFPASVGSRSARMAPVGQAGRHASHSRHRLCSTRATPFTTLMAPVGHTSVHRPQPVQRVSSTYTTVITFFLLRCGRPLSRPLRSVHSLSRGGWGPRCAR
jgi:hypothetical protein